MFHDAFFNKRSGTKDRADTYSDLFCVDSGKIVEHWDVIEPLLPESEWQHNIENLADCNGKVLHGVQSMIVFAAMS